MTKNTPSGNAALDGITFPCKMANYFSKGTSLLQCKQKSSMFEWRHETQHNNTQHNDTQHNIKLTVSIMTQNKL